MLKAGSKALNPLLNVKTSDNDDEVYDDDDDGDDDVTPGGAKNCGLILCR